MKFYLGLLNEKIVCVGLNFNTAASNDLLLSGSGDGVKRSCLTAAVMSMHTNDSLNYSGNATHYYLDHAWMQEKVR